MKKLTQKQMYAKMHKGCPTCRYWKAQVQKLKKAKAPKKEITAGEWELKHHRVR